MRAPEQGVAVVGGAGDVPLAWIEAYVDSFGRRDAAAVVWAKAALCVLPSKLLSPPLAALVKKICTNKECDKTENSGRDQGSLSALSKDFVAWSTWRIFVDTC